MRLSVQALYRFFPKGLLVFLLFAVLWKGGKSLETTWMLAGLAGAAIFLQHWGALRGGFPVRPPRRAIFLLAFLYIFWTVLSFILSSARNYGFDEVLRDVSLLLLFLWEIQRSGDREGIDTFDEKILRSIVIAALIASGVGVSIYALQPVSRFVGTFFDHRFHTDYWPNAWAEFLLLAWPIMLLPFSKGGPSHSLQMGAGRLRYLLCVAFLFASLFLSYSRGAVIALFAQGAFLIFLEARSFRFHRKALHTATTDRKEHISPAGNAKNPLWSIALRAILILTVSASMFGALNVLRSKLYPVQSVMEKVTFTAAEGGSSISERKQFWNQAVQLSARRPLFGFGPYSFRFVQPRVQTRVLATSDHAHNLFLKIASERGLPALLFLLLFLWLILYPSLRRSMGLTGSPRERLLLASVLGVLAHSIVDYNLQFVGIALPFFLILGMIEREGTGSPSVLSGAWVRRTEVLVASFLLIVAVTEGRMLFLSSLGRTAEARGDTRAALAWYALSSAEIFSRDMHLSRAHLLQDIGRLGDARDALRVYRMANSVDPRPLRMLGDIAFEEGDFPGALDAYDRAHLWNGFNDLHPLRGLLEITLSTDDAAAAESLLSSSDGLLVSYEHAIERNTHFIALGPNVEEFLAIMDLFAKLFPEESPLFEVRGAKIDRIARTERVKLESRMPGYLW